MGFSDDNIIRFGRGPDGTLYKWKINTRTNTITMSATRAKKCLPDLRKDFYITFKKGYPNSGYYSVVKANCLSEAIAHAHKYYGSDVAEVSPSADTIGRLNLDRLEVINYHG